MDTTQIAEDLPGSNPRTDQEFSDLLATLCPDMPSILISKAREVLESSDPVQLWRGLALRSNSLPPKEGTGDSVWRSQQFLIPRLLRHYFTTKKRLTIWLSTLKPSANPCGFEIRDTNNTIHTWFTAHTEPATVRYGPGEKVRIKWAPSFVCGTDSNSEKSTPADVLQVMERHNMLLEGVLQHQDYESAILDFQDPHQISLSMLPALSKKWKLPDPETGMDPQLYWNTVKYIPWHTMSKWEMGLADFGNWAHEYLKSQASNTHGKVRTPDPALFYKSPRSTRANMGMQVYREEEVRRFFEGVSGESQPERKEEEAGTVNQSLINGPISAARTRDLSWLHLGEVAPVPPYLNETSSVPEYPSHFEEQFNYLLGPDAEPILVPPSSHEFCHASYCSEYSAAVQAFSHVLLMVPKPGIGVIEEIGATQSNPSDAEGWGCHEGHDLVLIGDEERQESDSETEFMDLCKD